MVCGRKLMSLGFAVTHIKKEQREPRTVLFGQQWSRQIGTSWKTGWQDQGDCWFYALALADKQAHSTWVHSEELTALHSDLGWLTHTTWLLMPGNLREALVVISEIVSAFQCNISLWVSRWWWAVLWKSQKGRGLWRRQKMIKGIVQVPNLVLLTSSDIIEDHPYTQAPSFVG